MITCNIDENMGNRNLQTWSYTWFCKVLNECKLHMFLKIKSLFQLFQESFGPILEQIRNFPTSASSESMLPQSNPKNWIKTPTNSSKVRFEVSIKILRVRHSALLALFASIYSSSTLLNSCWLCYLLKSLKNTIKVSLVRNASNFSINQQ